MPEDRDDVKDHGDVEHEGSSPEVHHFRVGTKFLLCKHIASKDEDDGRNECKRYDRVLILRISRWELCNNLSLKVIVLVDSLIVSLRLTLLEPNLKLTELPSRWLRSARVKRNERHLVIAIDEIELRSKVNLADKLVQLLAPKRLGVDLQLVIILRVSFLESQIDLIWVVEHILL